MPVGTAATGFHLAHLSCLAGRQVRSSFTPMATQGPPSPFLSLPSHKVTALFVSCTRYVWGHNWLLPQGRWVTGGLTLSSHPGPARSLCAAQDPPGAGGLH